MERPRIATRPGHSRQQTLVEAIRDEMDTRGLEPRIAALAHALHRYLREMDFGTVEQLARGLLKLHRAPDTPEHIEAIQKFLRFKTPHELGPYYIATYIERGRRRGLAAGQLEP